MRTGYMNAATAPDKLDFSGKTVLVVGGTSGIGNGIACGFRNHGATVHIWGTRENVDAYRGDEGPDLEGLNFSRVDVSKSAEIESHVPPFSRLDVLVLSQGDSVMADGVSEYGWEKFSKVMTINVTSFMACSVKFKPMLAASKGSIIMLSSMGSLMGLPAAPAYCASKHAVTGLSRSLALGWAREGVRVNAIGPGVTPSRMAKAITDSVEFTRAVESRNPIGRLARVEEIADAALFLGSPMASYITGQTLIVDGGHTLIDTIPTN
jgi:3-oxoacyl-[acyl-carrier protein] reductase